MKKTINPTITEIKQETGFINLIYTFLKQSWRLLLTIFLIIILMAITFYYLLIICSFIIILILLWLVNYNKIKKYYMKIE